MNYKKIYLNIITNRRHKAPIGYQEIHHITPRCLGGTNDAENLIALTAKEHFICHLLLTKMYPKESIEYYKMCHAFMMMLVSSKQKERYITAKKYEILKTSYSKRMSMLQSGSGNSQYGTVWISNPTTNECKKSADGVLPDGWVLGRNRKFALCVNCGDQFIFNCNKKCDKCISIFRHNATLPKAKLVKPPKAKLVKPEVYNICYRCNDKFLGIANKKFCPACTKNIIGIQLIDDLGNIFSSMSAAARYHQVAVTTIKYRITHGKYSINGG